jgi:hypothetical protein
MKTLIPILAAALLIATPAAQAQQTSTKTHFAGERITGVSASSYFEVTLVKSTRTRAVVEASSEIERYLRVERDAAGIVSISTRNLSGREQRELNRLREDKKITMRLTLHLPSVNTIRLSGFTSLFAQDSFTGDDLDIYLSGHSKINGTVNISSVRAKVQCSGFSGIKNLTLDTTVDLVALVSGHSHVAIAAPKAAQSKLGVSGFSELRLSGSGTMGQWTVDGHSQLWAGEFAVKELTLSAAGFSKAKAGVNAAGADLKVAVSSHSEADIIARGVGLAKFEVTGFASMNIEGDGVRGVGTVNGHSRITADEFALKDLEIEATGFSTARVNASGNLTTKTDDRATVRYRGTPARINSINESVRPL